jgi:hypothetical protein
VVDDDARKEAEKKEFAHRFLPPIVLTNTLIASLIPDLFISL